MVQSLSVLACWLGWYSVTSGSILIWEAQKAEKLQCDRRGHRGFAHDGPPGKRGGVLDTCAGFAGAQVRESRGLRVSLWTVRIEMSVRKTEVHQWASDWAKARNCWPMQTTHDGRTTGYTCAGRSIIGTKRGRRKDREVR